VLNISHTSGKVFAATLFGVVILAFAAWKSPILGIASDTNGVHDTENTQTTEDILQSDEYTIDTDSDGVKDWEETLLGLDPNNPDSNGDGITDGEEIAQAKKNFEAGTISDTSSASSTQTDAIAREIFGAYIQSKQQGAYDEDSFDFIIAQATNSQFTYRSTGNYSANDVLTTSDVSTSRTLQYEKDFQDAILPVIDISEYELTTYGRAIETGDLEEFKKLTYAAGVYESIAQTLIEMTVPEDAVKPHLDLINSFSNFANTLTIMGSNPEDPMLTFVATRNFIEGEDAIRTAYSQMDIYFTLKELEA